MSAKLSQREKLDCKKPRFQESSRSKFSVPITKNGVNYSKHLKGKDTPPYPGCRSHYDDSYVVFAAPSMAQSPLPAGVAGTAPAEAAKAMTL